MKVNLIVTPKVKNSFYPTQSRCGSCPAPVPYPEGETRDELALPLLLDAYVQGAGEDPQVRKGSLHFLSSVFANIASSSTGRNFFYTPRPSSFLKPTENIEFPFAKIVVFTEHKDTIRRGGAASAIKYVSV